MTYAGVSGQTAEQMAQVLHFALPQEKLHPAFGEGGNRVTSQIDSRRTLPPDDRPDPSDPHR